MIKKSRQYLKITYNDGVTSLVIPPRYIASIEGSFAAEFNPTAELITGIAPPSTAQVRILKPTDFPQLTTVLSRSFDWRMMKIELFYSDTNGQNFFKVNEGLIFVRQETNIDVTFTIRGYLDLFNITLVESPLFRNRRVATTIPAGTTDADKATKLTAQNPYVIDGANVGVLNALLWAIGGRPYKYKSLYDNQYVSVSGEYPKFYFDLNASVMNPEWVWFNYENLLEDIGALCKAAGGILKQDGDGVIRFENVLNFRKQFSGITLTDSDYSTLAIDELGTEPYSRIVGTYTPRYLSGAQVVYSENLRENLEYNAGFTRQINFEKPVWKLLNTTISGQLSDTVVSSSYRVVNDSEQLESLDFVGRTRPVSFKVLPHTTFCVTKYVASGVAGNFTLVKDENVVSSQATTLDVLNDQVADFSSLYIGKINLYGRALESGPQQRYILPIRQFATISGFKELTLPDNPYVQSSLHIQRLVNISKYLMENNRMRIGLGDVPFTSGIALGTIVRVNSALNNVDEYFKVTQITHTDAFSRMDLEVISVSGLYMEDDLFIVGNSYVNTDVKVLSF